MSGLRGNASFNLGYVNLDLLSSLCEQLHVSMSLMLVPCTICYLDDIGSTSTSLSTSRTISVSKASGKAKDYMLILLSVCSKEMKLTSQRQFYDLPEDGEITPARSQGAPPWEDLEELKPRSDEKSSKSVTLLSLHN